MLHEVTASKAGYRLKQQVVLSFFTSIVLGVGFVSASFSRAFVVCRLAALSVCQDSCRRLALQHSCAEKQIPKHATFDPQPQVFLLLNMGVYI